MRTHIVAASVAFFGLTFFYSRRKSRKLFIELFAAAMLAGLFGLVCHAFQKFAYLAAITALIFKNRH
jgi:hypothetical protein